PALSSVSYTSGPLRHPHSFPTRRSSDLHGAEQRVEPGFAAVVALADRMPPTVAGKANLGACHMIQAHRCRQPSGGVGGRGDGREDRKSTRLNSSHVKISYAVFCLKKKKK